VLDRSFRQRLISERAVSGLDLGLRVRTEYDLLRVVAALELGHVPRRLRRRPRILIAELRASVLSLTWQTAR